MRSLILLGTLLIWLAPLPVGAHAFLEHAEPLVGHRVVTSPSIVRVWVDQALVGGRIRIENAAGHEIASSANALSPHDQYLLELALPQPLTDGNYHVYYEADDIHGHTTPGDFLFFVGPEARHYGFFNIGF